MTNPDNSLGTNGAFGGRTSVNAFNDVLATFDGAGIVSGFVVEPDSGMTVAVGGDGTTRDVAVAEDPFGNRTTVDNISGDPISVTINTASTTSARIDSIVAYVNSPATASDTSVDNPTACGIIAVNGTSGGAPLDSAIRTAITADGGTGSTAYYVVIANVSVPANTTTITSGLISAGKSINLTNVATSGSNGLMSGADKAKLDSVYDLTDIQSQFSLALTSQFDLLMFEAKKFGNLVMISGQLGLKNGQRIAPATNYDVIDYSSSIGLNTLQFLNFIILSAYSPIDDNTVGFVRPASNTIRFRTGNNTNLTAGDVQVDFNGLVFLG